MLSMRFVIKHDALTATILNWINIKSVDTKFSTYNAFLE